MRNQSRSGIWLSVALLPFFSLGCAGGRAAVEGGAAAAEAQPAPSTNAHLKIATVGADKGPPTIEVPAKIAFDEDHTSRVGSPISGRIETLLVKPGDLVKQGQPLLTLASADVEAALADQRAADADVSLTSKSLERLQGLLLDHAVAKKDVTQAENDLAKARAAQERSRARLALLHIDPSAHTSLFTLRAPIAGTVVERSVLPGSEVRSDSGVVLLTISDLRRVWVLADLYERDVAGVREGTVTDFAVPALPGRRFQAKVEHVGDVVDAQARTVKVRLAAENLDRSLKPEMYARASLPAAMDPAAVRVPSSAVLSEGEGNVVIVALADGQYDKRRVEVGGLHDGEVAVLAGLNPGDRIVTSGALFLLAQMNGR